MNTMEPETLTHSVLVVDDEQIVLSALRETLERETSSPAPAPWSPWKPSLGRNSG